MSMTELPIEKAFMFIEPGPVILVTTKDKNKNNIMTISWHMVIDFTPRIAMSTGPWNHTFKTLMRTKECVIAVPTVDLAEKVVRIGTCSGKEVDKFEKFELTPLPAKGVKAPLIGECLACIECKVIDYVEAHGIVILKAERVWGDIDRKERRTIHANGDGTFVVDGETINYRSLMEKWVPEGV
jgi:flavin reductase (DIM6/NTAB) family NADH-FMN oxidoreductase RutF